jgi:hypothetical protein
MNVRFLVVGLIAWAAALSTGMTGIAEGDPLLFESSNVLAGNADLSPDLTAGSHPYALTVSFKVAATIDTEGQLASVGGDPKDLLAELPPGLSVNPLAVLRCGAEEFATVNSATAEDGCPNASAVGVVAVENVEASKPTERKQSVYPIYDLVPQQGSPALFGFRIAGVAVYVTLSIRTDGDYGLTVAMTGMPQNAHVLGSTVTFWGVPAQSPHDEQRGDCIQSHGLCPVAGTARPMLTLPTQCLARPSALLHADSWQEPGNFSATAVDPIVGAETALSACEKLDFSPSLHVQAESETAATPTGLKLDLHIPQSEDPAGPAESNLKNAVIALPPGVKLNLARTGRSVGCPLEGAEGVDLGSSESTHCPAASRIGQVKIKTPFLPEELQGSLYLAQQGNLAGGGTNPFQSLIALYIVAEASGVLLKLPAEISADRQTGQLTMHLGPDPITGQAFAPQLPLEELELEFDGGPTAPFVTPETCGAATTSANLTPWNGAPQATVGDEFHISENCTRGFNPSFSAGTADKQANGYSTFTTALTRSDGDQELKSMSITLPPGLLGTLTGVTLCPEPAASLGTCGVGSLIGEATSAVGLGSEPFALTGAKVYLTGPYRGEPFGVSLVMPALVGPFNLGPQGHPIVIRASIAVDPITTQIKIATDPSDTYAIPSILEGIAPQIRTVNVVINRSAFIFNPTNCAPQPIVGTVTSTTGTNAGVSAAFQATNCASLPFGPKLKASTVGHPSRARGIGFNVKIVEGVAGEANARLVKVALPKQLPSRLTTLQKACVLRVFEANPAACPAGSIVGSAGAVTPILPVPMVGPAYFVSHGGAKFPELVIVLQGYGTTVEIRGETFINKAGITSSTFAQIPDAPVASFELHLPAGSNSALTTHDNLCGRELRTPTEIVAQNGAVIKEDPLIAIGGCPPAIRIVRHSVRRGVATLVVHLPSPGTLIARAKGFTPLTRKIGKAGTVTIRLAPTREQRRLFAHRHVHTPRVAVKLLLLTSHHGKLAAHVTIRLGH